MHTELDELKVEVISERVSVPIAENGYIGDFTAGNRIKLRAKVPSNVIPTKVRLGRVKRCRISRDDKRQVVQKIYVAQRNGQPQINHRELTIRLLELLPDGKINLWSLGIAIQRKHCFVVCQKDYELKWFTASHGGLVCPAKEKDWEEFCFFIREHAPEQWCKKVPSLPENWTKLETPKSKDLNSNQARVLWWNRLRGFGLVEIQALLASQKGINRKLVVTREQLPALRGPRKKKKNNQIPTLYSLRAGQTITFKRLQKTSQKLVDGELVSRVELRGIQL